MFRAAALVVALAPSLALASDQVCRRLDVSFTPARLEAQEPIPVASQMVAWLEDAAGNYVTTIYITDAVGRYGIGNRPGRYDFNSGYGWPYGRRITTFPVWAHAKPEDFPLAVFQDGQDNNLSHSPVQSSVDSYFCQPLLPDSSSYDLMTCATVARTDKGTMPSDGNRSLYPPRSDLVGAREDSAEVAMYEAMNPFDSVSHATPAENQLATVVWMVPPWLAPGAYVLVAEVSREFDQNETYSALRYPSPTGISYGQYGMPYRGQPSVIYRVPFTLGDGAPFASTLDYVGYGDPDGLDGDIRPPDDTITSDVPGSGAGRLAVASRAGAPYRLAVEPVIEADPAPPGAAMELEALDVTSEGATVYWTAPGDDASVGRAASYEIRYRMGDPITEENFAASSVIDRVPSPEDAGTLQSIALHGLLFDTEVSVGIRATDNCGQAGPLAVVTFRTAPRANGEVEACFVATAAYGSILATDVSVLRSFRDRFLVRSVLGQLFIQTYYTFAPTLSGVIAESDPLRELAREALGPIIERVRGY